MKKANFGMLALAGLFAGLSASMQAGASAFNGLRSSMRSLPGPKRTRSKPYIDRAGMPHGESGDKLRRKAAIGTVGLRHSRGPYAAWAMMARVGRR